MRPAAGTVTAGNLVDPECSGAISCPRLYGLCTTCVSRCVSRARATQAPNAITSMHRSLRRLDLGLLPAGREHHNARRPNLYSFIAPVALDRDA